MLQDKHEKFMSVALKQAEIALKNNEVPVGAVLVDKDNNIIAQGYNQVEVTHTQTAHAEMLVISQATTTIKNWRLKGYTLYVTLEPCTMCCAALQLSRVTTVVFGAHSFLFGYKKDQDQFIKPVDFAFKLVGGVLSHESQLLLADFFNKKRTGK